MPDAKRIFVVEDEFLVSLLLEEDLRASGYEVVGPFQDLASARASAAGLAFDVAVLDVNLNGTLVFPLAQELAEKKVPIVLLTGYSETNLPKQFRNYRRVAKPYELSLLLDAIHAASSGTVSA